MQLEELVEGFDTELSGPESHGSDNKRVSYGQICGGVSESYGNGGGCSILGACGFFG